MLEPIIYKITQQPDCIIYKITRQPDRRVFVDYEGVRTIDAGMFYAPYIPGVTPTAVHEKEWNHRQEIHTPTSIQLRIMRVAKSQSYPDVE